MSCAAAGDCTAAGEYNGGGGGAGDGLPFVVSETAGTWGSAEQLTGMPPDDDTTLVSCPDATDCAVAETYVTETFDSAMFTADEANGTWGQGKALGMPSDATDISGLPLLDCRSAGNCVISGSMDLAGGTGPVTVPFAATETSSGTWGAAATLAGIPSSVVSSGTQGLSCVPGGDCTLVGAASDGSIFTAVSGADGSIGTAQPIYRAAPSNWVVGLSCPQDGHCTLGLELNNAFALGTEATASTVTLAASAPKVTYGAEQSETLTATASSAAGGTPTGTVTVRADWQRALHDHAGQWHRYLHAHRPATSRPAPTR